MEYSISSLAFKGSVIEAISETKRHKKLFVVYMSGDNAASSNLEASTWTEMIIAEALSKYCILLHITEGTVDAAQLSAIYPQKSSPCITVIAYSGLQLWQHEGFITAEVLVSSIEKAWLNLHIQETFLNAALAANNSEVVAQGSTDSNSLGQGSFSSSDAPSSSKDKHVHLSEAKTTTAATHEIKHSKHALKEVNSKVDDEVFHAPGNESGSGHAEQSSPPEVNEPLDSVNTYLDNIAVEHKSVGEEFKTNTHNILIGHTPVSEEVKKNQDNIVAELKYVSDNVRRNPNNIAAADTSVGEAIQEDNLVHPLPGVKEDTSEVIASEANEVLKTDIIKAEKDNGSDISTDKSNDVHLNIRLPDFTSLQQKFSLTSTLSVIKDYVDEKQESSAGSYDLAIPYPRKVFSNEDLSKTLLELGLLNRQALIVVPHSQTSGQRKEGSRAFATNATSSSSGSSEGYLSLVKRMISYVNPLSYLGGGSGSASTVNEPQSRAWQYNPNPTLQNNLRSTSSSNFAQQKQTDAPASGGNRKRPTSSHFGSNIHTLKHDEDDNHQTGDRNTFWNGNSTEYGGDDDGK